MTSGSSANDTDESLLGFMRHEHGACISETFDAAEARCAAVGLRFTPVRRKVLEILLQEHGALGACTILDRLRECEFGSQPPVVYRVLDSLAANGLVRKIERLTAFIACAHPSHSHTPAFMICRLCEAIAETQSSPARGALGDATGFQIERTVVEAEGVRPACIEKADA